MDGDSTGLDKALSGVNSSLNKTQRSLKDVEKLLKLDPTNTQLLEQRQRLLGDAIGDAEKRLKVLREADKQAKAQLEAGTLGQDKYDALQREIIESVQNLKSLQEQAKKTSGINQKLTQFGAAATSASEKTKTLSTAAGGLMAAMVATVPATSELRSDLSKLDNNAKEAGVGIDATRDAFDRFNAVSDETDSSVEATSNLLQAGFTESNLQKAVEGLSGAYLRFPDTMKIESLADSLQETLATGQATGQFGELMDRLGIGAENFSKGLQECTTEAEKQNYAMQTLADAGLMDTYDGWVENNKELVESKQATQNFQEAMADLATTITPLITAITEFAAKALEAFNGLPGPVQKFIIVLVGMVAALSPVLGAVGKLSTFLGSGGLTGALTAVKGGLTAVTTALAGISAPVLAVIAAIAALIAIFATLWKTNEDFRNSATQVWAQVQQAIQTAITTIKEIFSAFVDLVNVLWAEWGDTIMEVVQNTVKTITTVLNSGLNIIKNLIKLVTSVLKGDWKGAWEAAKNIVKSAVTLFKSLVTSGFNTIVSIIRGVGSKIGSAVRSAFNSAISFLTSLPSRAVQWGRDFIDGIVRGIKGAIGEVTSAVKDVADKVRSFLHFSRPDEGPLHYYESWMPDMMKGLAKGIYDYIPEIQKAAKAAAATIDYEIMKDTPKAAIDYDMLYRSVRRGASDSSTTLYIGDRPFKRTLQGMGVVFEG